MSCSVGIVEAANLVITKKIKPTKINHGLPNALQLCGTSAFADTTCAAKHLYRQTYAFAVRHRLTRTQAQAAANATCPRHVASRSWMYSWHAIKPKDNFITCLTRTRH